jgi:outer membrane protein
MSRMIQTSEFAQASKFVLVASVAALGLVGPCPAETLQDALVQAYRTNPVLQGQRYQQQALDESYVQARAGWRPTASFKSSAQYEREPNSSLDASEGSVAGNIGQASITVSQPIYTGGRTAWAVRAAEATVGAGREELRTVEAQVLLSVIQAYADVMRDQQILAVRQADMATLEKQVAESSEKFKLGQVTKTDVAQAQAQLESARVSLAAAEAQLEISRAEYAAAVGQSPGQLETPTGLPGMPASVDQAFDLAEGSNPLLLQSVEKEKASRAQISAARAAYRPTVALQGTYGYIGPITPVNTRDYAQDVTGGVVMTMPILTGGVTASEVRQATAQNSSDRVAIEAAHRQVVQSVAQAWNQLLSGRAGVKAGEAQVGAADLALKGAQAEYVYGLRTTLDVLISDENLRSAQLSLAGSQHDVLLAEASVLQASGRLEAWDLLPAEPAYDPKAHFERVKDAARLPWEGVVQALDQAGGPGPIAAHQ